MGNPIRVLNSSGTKQMKPERNYKRRVNVCWEVNKERKCRTMSKDEAYALKEWLEENNGFCFWFQALDD